MRIIRQFFLSIVSVIWTSTEILILVLITKNFRFSESYVNRDDILCLIIIGLFAIMGMLSFFIYFPDELKKYKEKRDNNMKKDMILRSDIANMLKQYKYDEFCNNKLTKSDLEFIKELLLPVQAILIRGLQSYTERKNINLNDYAYEYADKCIQAIRDGDIRWALKWLISMFESSSFSRYYCCYCELITGTLLMSNILGLCDKELAEIAETEKSAMAPHGKYFMEKCVSDEPCLDNLDRELFKAGYDFFCTAPLKEYFDLTDEEYHYIKKSLFGAFRAVIACRKNKVSLKSYMAEIQDKISYFFSALGAPGHLAQHSLHSEKRENFHKNNRCETQN